MAGSRRFGTLAFQRMKNATTQATAPFFSVPILDGGINPIKEYGDLPRIGSTLARLGRFAQSARVGGTVQMLAHPEALTLLLYEVCGGYSFTTGTPATHRFFLTDALPTRPLTTWSSVGNQGTLGSVVRGETVYCTRLSLQGTSQNNVLVEADFVGFSFTLLSAIPALQAAQTGPPAIQAGIAEDASPRFKHIGSQVKIDPNGTTVVAVTNANSITLEVVRDPEIRYGTSLTPVLIAPDRQVNASFGFDYDDAQLAWTAFNAAYTGSPTGTTPNQGTALGSYDVTFGKHPGTANSVLRAISGGDNAATPAARQNWDYIMDRPGASGEPDTLTLDVNGQNISDSLAGTGSEATFILTNDLNQDVSVNTFSP